MSRMLFQTSNVWGSAPSLTTCHEPGQLHLSERVSASISFGKEPLFLVTFGCSWSAHLLFYGLANALISSPLAQVLGSSEDVKRQRFTGSIQPPAAGCRWMARR